MSIGSIGSASNWPAQQSSSMQSNWQNILTAASGTLGMTAPALQQQLQSGSSLSSIAQSQGVSQQTLISSISGALTQNGSTATGSQLQTMATNIADRTPGGHHHHHHGGGGSTSDATAGSSATDTLGADSTSATSSTDDPLMAALTASSSSSSGSPFADLSDPSSPTASASGLANVAAESDLWQGIDLTA
jgi:hypothetical protein